MTTFEFSKVQKEVFDPTEERMLAMVNCFKRVHAALENEAGGSNASKLNAFISGLMKRRCCLCLLSTSNVGEGHLQFSSTICLLKLYLDNPLKAVIRRKAAWPIRQLNVVDGFYHRDLNDDDDDDDDRQDLSEDENKVDFDLVLDGQVFEWTAVSAAERDSFLSVLVTLASRCRKTKGRRDGIIFVNLPPKIMALTEHRLEDDHAQWIQITNEKLESEDQKETEATTDLDEGHISAEEEKDLQTAMESFDNSVMGAQRLLGDLKGFLDILIRTSVCDLVSNEDEVLRLISYVDDAIGGIESVEDHVDNLNAILDDAVKDSLLLDKFDARDYDVINANNRRLLCMIEETIQKLDLEDLADTVQTNLDAGSESEDEEGGVGDFADSAFLLKDRVEVGKMVEAAKILQRAKEDTELDGLTGLAFVRTQLNLHKSIQKPLSRSIEGYLYGVVLQGLRQMELSKESSVSYSKTPSMSTITLASRSDDIKLTRMSNLHQGLLQRKDLVKWLKDMDQGRFGHFQGLYKTTLGKWYKKEFSHLLVDAGEAMSISVDQRRLSYVQDLGKSFDQLLHTVLQEIAAVCNEEQDFCAVFFDMGTTDESSSRKIRAFMSELFPSILDELYRFLVGPAPTTSQEVDGSQNLTQTQLLLRTYVVLTYNVWAAERSLSFVTTTFGTALVQVKRSIDTFMNTQLKSIQDDRGPLSTSGLLPALTNLERFVALAEAAAKTAATLFDKDECRAEIRKWYGILMVALMEAIRDVANKQGHNHLSYQPLVTVIINFHYINTSPVLKGIKPTEVRDTLEEAIANLTELLSLKPLERVNIFFDGVRALVNRGVKADEVGFHVDFSKHSLRKVMASYPAFEVMRDLDQLRRKVIDTLFLTGGRLNVVSNLEGDYQRCRRELAQRVWTLVRDQALNKLEKVRDTTRLCYPNECKASFDFTAEEFSQFFGI